jgi:SAM-dependent methyltransferase
MLKIISFSVAVGLLLAFSFATSETEGNDAKPTGLTIEQQLEHHTFPSYSPTTVERMGLLPRSGKKEPLEVLSRIASKTVVADIGCGAGRLTFAMAQKVGPEGRVYALDMQKSVLDLLRVHLPDRSYNPHDNISVIQNKVDDTLLPPGILDQAWMVNIHFHNFPDPRPENIRMIRSVFRSLKPDGQLIVIDAGAPPYQLSFDEVRANIIHNYERAGFEHLPEMDVLSRSASAGPAGKIEMTFRKPAGQPDPASA